MKKIALGILMVIGLSGLLLAAASPAQAQSEYRLNVQRVIGYSSGSQIRGTFVMEVVGPDNIQSATFLIDGKPMGEAAQKPFRLQFKTTDYGNGGHELSAALKLTTGETAATGVRNFVFATPEQESTSVIGILFPLLGGIAIVMAIVIGGQFLFTRNKANQQLPLGAPRHYGYKGGSICPRCHRPFGLHVMSLNLLVGVLDRCDFCGKWGFYRPLRYETLKAAEAAELQQAQPEQPIREKSEEEKLKEMLDDSKFTDHN